MRESLPSVRQERELYSKATLWVRIRESLRIFFMRIRVFGPIAQSVEHRADNAGVDGSKPSGPIFSLKVNDCEKMVLRKPTVSKISKVPFKLRSFGHGPQDQKSFL